MKTHFTFILLIFITATVASSQPGDWNVKTFGDDTLGYYQNNANWEETVYLRPEATGFVEKIFIYLTGNTAARDTVFISGDPAESGYPPSLFVRQLNTYAMFIIDYEGEPKWYEFDVSELNIISSPIKPILVQHLIKSGGPFFLMDKKQGSPATSFINDIFNPRPDFYNLMGLRASLTQGDYYAAMKINYDIETVPKDCFTDVTISAGLVNENGEALKQPMASVVDFDMDGWDDVVISGYLFRNMQDGTFKLHSKPFNPNPAGTTWGDLNNDGFVDVFTVNGMGNDKIYWGSAEGDFFEKTPTEVVFNQPTVTPMFLDYNNDGLLDIYIAFGRRTVNNQEIYYPDKLLKNLGGQNFIDVTGESKIAAAEAGNPRDTWGASVCDFNNDFNPDIFVANYRLEPDFLFENIGDGTFNEAAKGYKVHGVPTADSRYFGHGMGSDWGDFDNDGDQDLAVGNLAHFDSRGLYSNKSLIYRNDGSTFEDVTDEMRLGFYEMNGGIVWADLDNDSWLDIVHGQISYKPRGEDSDRLTRVYLNSGEDEGFRLQDITYESGVNIHGAWCPIRFDFDKDGDMDLLIASNLENVKLYRNDMPQKGKYLNFFLKGAPESAGVNLDAYGSKIEVTHRDKTYTRWLSGSVHSGRAAQNTNMLHFGIPSDDEAADMVKITFSDGKSFELENLPFDRTYHFTYDILIPNSAPDAPQPEKPLNKSSLIGDSVRFIWDNESLVSEQDQIQVSKSPDFDEVIYDYTTISHYFTITDFADSGEYFWRLKSSNHLGESDWSEVFSFTLDTESSVEDIQPDNPIIAISPNPADDMLTVSFVGSKFDAGSFIIYDVAGYPVISQNASDTEGSPSEIRIDVSGLNSGVYYFVTIIGDRSIREKFVVLR